MWPGATRVPCKIHAGNSVLLPRVWKLRGKGNHVAPTGGGCTGRLAGPSHPHPATQIGHELFLQEDKG